MRLLHALDGGQPEKFKMVYINRAVQGVMASIRQGKLRSQLRNNLAHPGGVVKRNFFVRFSPHVVIAGMRKFTTFFYRNDDRDKSSSMLSKTMRTTVASDPSAPVKGTSQFMATTTLKLGISALVIASAASVLVVQHQSQIELREENQSLRQQMAKLQTENERLSKHPPVPHLPAPPMNVTTSTNAPTEDLQPTNLYARFKDTAPKLTTEQVEAFLKANGRTASSLLAAFRTSGDPALLREAMEKYPNDPQVAFEAVYAKDLSPEQQRQWLDTFEKSAPDNALANYLSALNYFNSGQIDQGVQELTAASGKQQFQDYTLNRIQDDEEAYLLAGYSAAEAERISSEWITLPQLAPMKRLGQDLVALANAYSQSGDSASAQAVLQMAMNLGQRYADASASAALVSQLVGTAIERMALDAMDPNSPYGGNGQTVQDQLNQMAQQKAAINELWKKAEPLMPTMSDQDWISYTDRRKIFGEVAAWQWVVSKYGQK